MLSCLALVAVSQANTTIERDAYGVPMILASSPREAMRHAGYAVAQDRLWQMEQSRRLARGRLAEVFGSAARASDREVLAFAYTDEELQKQVDGVGPKMRDAMEAYAEGVNAYIADAKKNGRLPRGYSDAGFQPEPWSPVDSAAIAVRMGQLFGRGGAGELRNLALLEYLKTQPAKDRALDVFDDFLWLNEPASPTTVKDEDDPVRRMRPRFNIPTREETQKHLDALPKVNLLEMLPALRLATGEESALVAETRSVPFKTGSYAVVVGSKRSANGRPILLSAPQMGFTTPAVIHEMSLSTPEWGVAGLNVPGVPGVIIGHSRHMAWGLTSGVADTEDVFVVKLEGDDGYRIGERSLKFERVAFNHKVKGQPDESFTQLRTEWGPVILTSKSTGVAYVRRSAYWMRELSGFDAMFGFYTATSASDMERIARTIPLTFNLFYANTRGEIGYRYCGFVPQRAPGVDPRFPIPAEPANNWLGMIPAEMMPHVVNPKDGLLTNWNNKPVSWWANGDTPAWGRIFRQSALSRFLTQNQISVADVEMAAWGIARFDETAPFFLPIIRQALTPAGLSDVERRALAHLNEFDGRTLAGSQGAKVYKTLIATLREELFQPSVGNFMQPSLFEAAAQPSVILNALQGRTKFDYRGGKTAGEIVRAAFAKAVTKLGEPGNGWRFMPSTIASPDGVPIPYRDRGSYIQIVELGSTPSGRNVLPPGVAESGPHTADQVPLARQWTYKEMRIR